MEKYHEKQKEPEINFKLEYEEVERPGHKKFKYRRIAQQFRQTVLAKPPIKVLNKRVNRMNITKGELRKRIEIKKSSEAGIAASKQEVKRIRKYAAKVTK